MNMYHISAILLSTVFFTLAVMRLGFIIGYKDGQIQCINGNIQYELKEQPDKATKWIPSKK